MNIFIAGGGRVGYHLARLLSLESHDVTVVETETNRVEQVDYALDVSVVEGNAASIMLLTESGAGSADLFVSVTGSDEVNLISAAIAKGLGAKQVVARVDDPMYIESSVLYETVLAIDYLLSPEALNALEIAKYLENPGVVSTEDFGRGLVKMRQLRVTKSPVSRGKTLKDIQFPAGTLVGAITRNGHTVIAHGDASIEPGDLVTFIGEKDQIEHILGMFKGSEVKAEKVVIMGGSSIGLHLARILEDRGQSPKIIDWNLERCNTLAGTLLKTKVVCRDATSRVALEQEHVDRADVFIACTGDDEKNIMASVLAKEVGATQAIAVVHQPDFAPLVRKLGIDHAVTPRASIANRILKLVHQQNVSSLAVLEEGDVEILELAVNGNASVLGKALKDIRLPRGALVAGILRKDKVIVPKGDSTIQTGDSIILIVNAETLESVQKLFQK
ncbi:MAG: Trk system potassium transporter TrkA [Candidatus Hydrogenedentes bacterium]|nr:Trk system potassium transporter TrkA [Candidatus Hydrogenedentota bacterium]